MSKQRQSLTFTLIVLNFSEPVSCWHTPAAHEYNQRKGREGGGGGEMKKERWRRVAEQIFCCKSWCGTRRGEIQRSCVLKEDGEQWKMIGWAVRRRGQSLNDLCDSYQRKRRWETVHVCVCEGVLERRNNRRRSCSAGAVGFLYAERTCTLRLRLLSLLYSWTEEHRGQGARWTEPVSARADLWILKQTQRE